MEHEGVRLAAKESILIRNPLAFQPKIQSGCGTELDQTATAGTGLESPHNKNLTVTNSESEGKNEMSMHDVKT